jgi:hypothetical protein
MYTSISSRIKRVPWLTRVDKISDFSIDANEMQNIGPNHHAVLLRNRRFLSSQVVNNTWNEVGGET